jgi:glycosyltransferase involved in cell wall biosynthesis
MDVRYGRFCRQRKLPSQLVKNSLRRQLEIMRSIRHKTKPIDLESTDWLDDEKFGRTRRTPPKPELSVVIPVYNESGNIELLYDKLIVALTATGLTWEVIFVDDGSIDKSYEELETVSREDQRIKVVKFVRNFGQTAALAAGIDHATGKIIIPMDADLQNDPADIKLLLAKMEEGYDVVSGWRKDRQDALLNRLIPSWIANKIISVISGVRLHDYGCSLKAYRREVIKNIRLYGEMHRFVPIYASWQGARVTEIPVNHYARQIGQSKYGISRTFKVILDLITVKFMSSYFTKPIYVFGTAGIAALGLSLAAFVWMVALKYVFHTHTFIETPLPVLIAMFFMVGIQFIMMGLLAEILMRTYHESQGKRIYIVEERLNTLSDDATD